MCSLNLVFSHANKMLGVVKFFYREKHVMVVGPRISLDKMSK